MQTGSVIKIERFDTVTKQCDRCKRSAHRENDVFEFQEFQFYYINGGFGSVFGDGSCLECDLCQHCVKELIGPYLRDASTE